MNPACKKIQSYIFANVTLLTVTALSLTPFLALHSSAQSTSTPSAKITQTEIKYVTPVSGKEMYDAYCADCHGVNGKVAMSTATALNLKTPDLTQLSAQNGGSFPKDRIRSLLMDLDLYPAHRVTNMPHWAPALQSLNKDHPELVGLRVQNLMAYLETLQAPPAIAGTDRRNTANPK